MISLGESFSDIIILTGKALRCRTMSSREIQVNNLDLVTESG